MDLRIKKTTKTEVFSMSIFQASQYYPLMVSDLAPAANDVVENFRQKGYEVKEEETVTKGWHISLHKGGIFKSILGLKTALNVEIENTGMGITAKAGVGIFGLQAIPTAITLFVAWPVLLTQIWGLVQQASLDKEVLECIGCSLSAHSIAGPISDTAAGLGAKFCVQCGATIQQMNKFCPNCGKKVE
jgi:hypothetical protein